MPKWRGNARNMETWVMSFTKREEWLRAKIIYIYIYIFNYYVNSINKYMADD